MDSSIKKYCVLKKLKKAKLKKIKMLAQIKYILGAMLVTPFLPYLLWQGKKIKERMPDLPPAGGPSEGLIGEGAEPLRLLCLGESTIAGVGAANHRESLAGHIAQRLYEKTGRAIAWQVIAQTGFTARQTRELLTPRIDAAKPTDIILIGLGGNDTFQLNQPRRWRKDFIDLIQSIREKQPKSQLVIANLPPVGSFPAFPKAITTILGNLVKLHASAIRDFPQLFSNLHFNNREITLKEWMGFVDYPTQPEDYYSDGVHPSPLTYSLWGQELAEFMINKKLI